MRAQTTYSKEATAPPPLSLLQESYCLRNSKIELRAPRERIILTSECACERANYWALQIIFTTTHPHTTTKDQTKPSRKT